MATCSKKRHQSLCFVFFITSALLVIGSADAQITQQFTGTIGTGVIGSTATGFFATPYQAQVSGTFTLNPGDLGPPSPGVDSYGNYNMWNQYALGTPSSQLGMILNPNRDFISASSPNGSVTVPNLTALELDGAANILLYQYSGPPSYQAELLIHCNQAEFAISVAAAFPLFIPQNCAGQINFADSNGNERTVLLSSVTSVNLSSVQLMDPTPLALTDLKQSMMDGNHVSTDPAMLDTFAGRAVQGIAADGTAEIVLRIPTNANNDIVTATVLSDTCTNSADPSTCAVSTSAAFDGGLVALSNAANPAQAAPTAPVTAADSNRFAYVIYRAPVDFVRLGKSVDELLNTRSIQFKLTYQTAQGTSYGTQYVPLTIVRPPVVLTHGYASSADETWNGIWNDLGIKAHTTVYEVDYSAPIQLVSTIPAICGFTCVTLVRQSDLGVTYNTPVVATQTKVLLRDYALGHNAANGPVAVSQIDSIAHSMGGLIERYWSTNAAKDSAGNAYSFNTPENFGEGYIHKLITLGTPHFGSPLATESASTGQPGSVSDPGAGCFRTFSAVAERFEVGIAILDKNGTAVGGAIGDLDGDGIGLRMSTPLNDIKASAAHLPTFAIAGTATPGVYGGYDFVNAACGLLQDPVADRMTIQLYGTLFDPALTPLTETMMGASTPNDGAVPETSALHGQSCNGPGAQCFAGDAHGVGTALLLGASTNLVEDTNVLLLVQQLLNTSVVDSTKWVIQ